MKGRVKIPSLLQMVCIGGTWKKVLPASCMKLLILDFANKPMAFVIIVVILAEQACQLLSTK
jgi:hypothetical protein